MYLYLYHRCGPFKDLKDFDDLDHLDEQGFMPQIYVNLTNACTCSCTFCLRDSKAGKQSELWLKHDPTIEELCGALDAFDLTPITEVVFCGFGEPTMRLETLLALTRHVHEGYPDMQVRVNTNGLANAYYGHDITTELAKAVNAVSISLNTSDPERYAALTRNQIGVGAHGKMLDFARLCKEHGMKVSMTAVDCIDQDDIDACAKLCEGEGLNFHVRAYSSD